MPRGWLCYAQTPHFGRLFSTFSAFLARKGTRCRFFFLQRALFALFKYVLLRVR